MRERGLCSRCLSRCDPKGERMHKRCRLKSRIENELCQRQRKCRQTHHRLLHVDAEGEKSPQTARLAKPAKLPDRPGRSPTHSRAEHSPSFNLNFTKYQKPEKCVTFRFAVTTYFRRIKFLICLLEVSLSPSVVCTPSSKSSFDHSANLTLLYS